MAKSPQKTYQLTGLPERMVIMGLLLLVFAVATVQLVKDLNQVDWSRVVAALPAIEEANKLAAAKPADPVTKLSLISDNYSRCQNKLGQMLYEAHKDTVLDKNQVNLELYKFYLTGARYVMIKIYDYNETAKQAVILVSQQAYKNHLVPILYMMSENGTTVDQNIKNTVSFLRAIDEATDALKFIATTSPNSYMNDDNRQVDAVQISIGVAKDLMEFPDIATTTPEMWVDRLSENDRVETLHNLGLGDDGALVPFDYMLLSYQNRDYEYSQGSSDYAMRAYTEFSEPYPNKPDLGKQVFPAKQWLRDENNQVFRQHMQAIIVGFGPPTYKPDEGKLSADPVGQLGYDFGSFSDDPDIAAVIFQGNSESTLNLSSQDLAKINKFGTNCKYDIEVSDFSYPTSAKAAACEVRQSAESPAQADTSTWTKVVCDNVGQPTGTCYAAIYYTVQVGLPIRSFGSNSAIGTETNPYMPVSAYIAYQNGINSLDALNQYAGKLTSTNGQTYTVPWLGNAIYNSSELLRTRFSGGFDPFINGELRYNDSAVAGERIAELNDAYSRDQAAEYDYTSNTTWCYDPSSGLDGRKIVTLDEYALYDGKNFCLDKSQIELIDSLAQYDPIKYAGRQTEVNACNSEVYRVKRDPQNMIYGSEQVLNKEEWFSTKSELCYNAWRGEGNLIDQGINCTASSVPITALNPTAGDCRCQENPGLFASKYNIQNGLCTLTTAQQNSCIQYNSGADSYASASVRLQPQQKLPGADGISSVPKYDIEGAYAALAAVYKNVQDAMSRRGLKIIFNEKLGWESEVILRAYRDTAGEDAQINYGRTNNMLDQFTRNYPSLSAAIAAERGEQSSGSSTFSNSNPKSASSKVCGINIDPGNAGGYPTGGAALSGIGWARLVYKESDAGKMDQYIQELNKAGVNVLLVLNQETYWGDGTNNWNQGDMGAYANAFAAKAAEIAKKYQGQVLAYEIWNEPDGVGEAFAHLEPSQLNTIASSAISAINSADLDAFVVVGGLLGGEGGVVNYIKGMPDAMSKADAISVHPYTKGADDSLGNYLRTILAAKQTVWITEFSWEGSPMSGDPAGYVTSFYDYLATNFSSSVPVAVLYAWSDAMQSDRGNFGIVDASGNPKQPVFDTFYEKGCGAVAPLSSEGSSSGASFSIPGTYMTNLNLYPAEGRNYDVYNEYYQMLGVIDELMRINDVYLNDDFFETGAIQSNGTVFSEDAAETYVGLYGCDSQAYKLALANLVAAGVPNPSLNCIGLVSDHDPVGDFLCEKGYAADNLCNRGLFCQVSPESRSGAGNSTLVSLDGVSSGLVKMTEKIESTMCIPKGLLLAMMEREVTDVLASIVGDPFEQIQQRISSAQTVWGPAQFHDIAWIKTGYGVLGSDAFNGTGVFEFGTKQCLDALGISYDQSAAVHFQDQNADSGVLERSYLGYALCAAAAKLKNDSKTGAGSCTWDQTAVERAAESYLGACSQNGRDYCSVYSETICNLYPNSNPALCSASGDSPDLICKPPQDYLCTDGNIRLLHPLNDLSARVSQPWGGADNHNGVDYAVPAGSPVYAAAPGIVVKMMDHWPDPNASDLENAAGNFVKIRHDQIDGVQTFYTSYQHLNGVSVQVGDRVQAGELIGTSGTTGRSSGPHLHFELRLRDCYDGYGEGDYELGQCSADPTQYILDESGFTNCDKTGENAPIIDGEFTCPVLDPGSARILQTSNGSGSHSRPDISPQKPTDIGAPNHIIVAPVSGTVRIVTPVDTVNTYGGGICDYIRLPDGNPSNDAEINWDVIKQQSLVEDPSGSGIFKRGSITYDSRIDDEGDYYYDGGFVVHITDKDGNLWRLVHVKDLLVANGAVVEVGEPIGKVYDGQLSGEWADWSVKPQDGSGCFSVQYAHLHFAIISADAVENQYYQGNTIDSTPWVQKYCGL